MKPIYFGGLILSILLTSSVIFADDNTPKIEYVEPIVIIPGKNITMKGSNLGKKNKSISANAFFIKDGKEGVKSADIVDWNENEINIMLRGDIENGKLELKRGISFEQDDIKKELISKLIAEVDTVSQYIVNKYKNKSKKDSIGHDIEDVSLQKEVLDILNELLDDKDFYSNVRFPEGSLNENIQNLVVQKQNSKLSNERLKLVKNFFQIDYPCGKTTGRFANLMPLKRHQKFFLFIKTIQPCAKSTGSSR